eukprot:TRINITY_DN8706_c0_g1_i1.p1 TRINITY_DN8706_c0_g1~~TRINITY_DN8706_c0_g1_i1.p1  ORF type:complete len:232 (+),score=1.93 TRINITY_DN8706_c0_g1_i1:94-696(+)
MTRACCLHLAAFVGSMPAATVFLRRGRGRRMPICWSRGEGGGWLACRVATFSRVADASPPAMAAPHLSHVDNSIVSLVACAAARSVNGAIIISRSLLHLPPVKRPRPPPTLKLPRLTPPLRLSARLPRALAERVGVALALAADKHGVVGVLQGAPLDAHVCAAPVGALLKATAVPHESEDVLPVLKDGGDGHPLLVAPPA